jgi:hypothetical protein
VGPGGTSAILASFESPCDGPNLVDFELAPLHEASASKEVQRTNPTFEYMVSDFSFILPKIRTPDANSAIAHANKFSLLVLLKDAMPVVDILVYWAISLD